LDDRAGRSTSCDTCPIAGQCAGAGESGAGGLASVLPQIIDQMTQQGQLPQGGDDLVSQALAILNQTKMG
jgi:hypothetical protein